MTHAFIFIKETIIDVIRRTFPHSQIRKEYTGGVMQNVKTAGDVLSSDEDSEEDPGAGAADEEENDTDSDESVHDRPVNWPGSPRFPKLSPRIFPRPSEAPKTAFGSTVPPVPARAPAAPIATSLREEAPVPAPTSISGEQSAFAPDSATSWRAEAPATSLRAEAPASVPTVPASVPATTSLRTESPATGTTSRCRWRG